jgi:hypothetical protein
MKWVSLLCPSCWQPQEIQVEDPGPDHVEMMTDCEVCCRPMRVRYWRGAAGEVEVDIAPGND